MRQAGRYMPEYRALRERMGGILAMVKDPAVAAEVTLQPMRAFGLDAAIVFADILTLLEPMGLRLEFVKNEGPRFLNPLAGPADIRALRTPSPHEDLSFTLEAIRLAKRELGATAPLIGFSGAPFTLACYAIEGGSSRDFIKTKSLMYREPAAWDDLMTRLAAAVGEYLRAQIEAGADAVQLFDSWVGALSPDDFRRFALPYVQRALSAAVADRRVPRIYFGTGTAGLMGMLPETGAEVVGVDWRIDLAAAWQALGPGVAVQGNLDPVLLFSSPEEIQRQARRVLDSVRGRPGHIFNLGHGVLEHTPMENVRALVEFVCGGRHA
jgi:uroporphyrinogen decarboxylase